MVNFRLAVYSLIGVIGAPMRHWYRWPLYKKVKVIAIAMVLLTWYISYLFPKINYGMIGNNPWIILATTCLAFHISMVVISIYLHRSETHRGIRYAKPMRHFFRFWLWFISGIDRTHWVAVHRYHHQHTETEKDPHSPVAIGLNKQLTHGIEIYNEAFTLQAVKQLGVIRDNDWLEKKLYSHRFGILFSLLLFILLFGLWGIPCWTMLMVSQIFAQNFVINGLGHHTGYRNYNTDDNSRNISRFGVLISGEELHNNHHKNPRSPRFSRRRNEYDLGWFYIVLLYKLGLAKVELKRIYHTSRNQKLHTIESGLENDSHYHQ
ncbi:fatty acid desaturase [Legionella sp. W05-934-2]|uniref:fatty acid desaturase n=1 Tax=Legionella sp. W05-934-2 TaxID=1198649 RepID=UPI003462AEE7